MSLHHAVLAGPTDWPGFRQQARALLAQQLPPDDVMWSADGSVGCAEPSTFLLPFGDDTAQQAPSSTEANTDGMRVPAGVIALCETVILHSDPSRFALMYRLLWRLQREPGLRHDPLDADRLRARHMAKAVRRDMHKMTAFVRFRELAHPDEDGNTLHVAWFEPSHHIVEAIAPFFMRRFTQMRWAIVTPERSVRWDGRSLEFGPGGQRSDTPPADAGEALWLTYYRHIFNPARLKLAMMQKEMPRKYWRNLPEAELIAPLAAQAMARTGGMIDAPATVPHRRIAIRDDHPHANAQAAPSRDSIVTLADLREAGDRCRDCPIGAHATQAVFGEGPRGALMVVGEQPGDQEDLHGRPFVGPAGQLFDRALAQLGWPREQLYITNAVRHFKFELRGKRRIHKTPNQREAEACLHWLEREMDLVQPKALIALGSTAARSLLGRNVAVMRERGQWHVDARGRRVLVTLHPSALLRGEPAQHEAAFARWLADLRMAAEFV